LRADDLCNIVKVDALGIRNAIQQAIHMPSGTFEGVLQFLFHAGEPTLLLCSEDEEGHKLPVPDRGYGSSTTHLRHRMGLSCADIRKINVVEDECRDPRA